MQVVIVRSCDTSKGRITVEIPGGTKDTDPMEFGELEARRLIALGHARLPPPHPAVAPPAPAAAPVPEKQES